MDIGASYSSYNCNYVVVVIVVIVVIDQCYDNGFLVTMMRVRLERC